MKLMRLTGSIAKSWFMILPLMMVSGCLPVDVVRDIFGPINGEPVPGSGQNNPYHIDIDDIRIPAPGEKLQVTDPGTGSEITVTVETVYTSASGTLCSTFSMETSGRQRSGLACLNKDREWQGNKLELRMMNSR